MEQEKDIIYIKKPTVFSMPNLAGKSITASPRASHYKAKEIVIVLSKLNFSYLFHFALLHFSRVLPVGIEPTIHP